MIKSIRASASAFAVTFISTFFLTILFPDLARASEDFSREPDATISTQSLSNLPKDILTVPILKDLLTEDFVFYYRDGGADWMSFRGALARIAFEKDTNWPTDLLKWLMSSPAEIALWRSADGKLDQFMLVFDQTGVKALVESIAKTAGDDSQLKTRMVDGRNLTVMTLSNEREVFMASESGRFFIFSNAAMRVPDSAMNRSISDRAKSFFGTASEIGIYGPKLSGAEHVITVSANYLSFGYQAFFSTLRALRFDFKKEWSVEALTSGRALTITEKDWTLQARGAALCLAVPLEIEKIGSLVKAKAWLDKASGTATACWYAESKFYSPVIAVHGDFAPLLPRVAELKPIFTNLIGSKEAYWLAPAEEGTPSILKWKTKIPVVEEKILGGGIAWSRAVGGRYGLNSTKSAAAVASKLNEQLTSNRYFRVKLAVTSNALIFSPDDKLVDKALLTLGGKFPSMAASLVGKGKSASFILAPASMAKLAKQSVLDSLPASSESLFRTSVSRHLLPNLDRVAKRPMQTATVRDSSASPVPTWKKLEWTTHASR